MSEWVPVAKVGEIPDGGVKVVEQGNLPVAILRSGEAYYAVMNLCPHRGGPVAEGEVDGATVVCPWHGWQFDVSTGRGVNSPAARLRTFPVQVRDGVVQVQIDG
jgi:nitrite reductase/ring-hydroxylating ferredoxin subunit